MSAPDSVHELAKARQVARAEKNFALSDQLRDEIAAQGFEVVDVAGGYELRPKKRFPTYESTRDIRPINSGKFEITVAMIIDGFHEDAVTTIKSIKEHSQCAIALLVIGDPGVLVNQLDSRTSLVHLAENFGWGESANALLRNVTSEFIVIMDPSTRFTGDAITPVLAELKSENSLQSDGAEDLSTLKMNGEALMIKAQAKSMFSLVTSWQCIAKTHSQLADSVIVLCTIAMLISNFRSICAMQMDDCYRWNCLSNKIAIMVITTLIPNIAMLNQRRITTAFSSASEVKLQY